MKVLFWNAGKNKVDSFLVSLANTGDVDLIILAEYDPLENSFLALVNRTEEVFEEIPQIGCNRITIFIRLGIAAYEHGPESSYFTSKKLIFSDDFSMLLVGVHLPSKLYQSEQTQLLEASEFKREIEDAEDLLENHNTFIIGDFNMNPFEGGMVGASAFHSIPCEKIARYGSRTIKDREHKFFYNPMWNLFGDNDNNPGSYYHRSSEQTVYFWNILDQVILRPELSPFFIKSSLEVLQSIGGAPLVSDTGKPNVSDHLPIKFEFNLNEVLENEEFVA
ncbi:MAG: hypothetical protein ACC707_19860 [Thiohalomonadales bacterium]